MMIGICGKPNSGKSTLFNALTLAGAEMANYPFTTIEPNKGITYVRTRCPCKEFNVKCKPRYGFCSDGTRYIPITVIDIAGLVPDAHLGRGLGNQFLTDLAHADALIQVIDISGRTDLEGKEAPSDPSEEIEFLRRELIYWIKGIIDKHWNKIRRKDIRRLGDVLQGLKISYSDVERVVKELGLPQKDIDWSDSERFSFSERILITSKPMVIAANKIDVPGAEENLKRVRERYPDLTIIPTSAAIELALRRAAESGLIEYVPGSPTFKVIGRPTPEQEKGLTIAQRFLEQFGSTGVQQVLDTLVFEKLGMIVVYPVEDEHTLSDSKGNVLPDAILLPKGSTPLDLAYKIHSDLGDRFIGAIDVRTKKKIGKDHVLNNGDVIKILFKK